MIKDGKLVCDICGEELPEQPTGSEIAQIEEEARAGRHRQDTHIRCLRSEISSVLPRDGG